MSRSFDYTPPVTFVDVSDVLEPLADFEFDAHELYDAACVIGTMATVEASTKPTLTPSLRMSEMPIRHIGRLI